MELDSHSLDSDDEGVELSAKDHDDEYFDEITTSMEEEAKSTFLEAKVVYLLLPRNVPVSRASRLQWLLEHLNTVITVPAIHKWDNSSNLIEIVSVIPREPAAGSKCNRYLVNARTEAIFLAHSYRLVYCLDMSPSQAIVDIQKGEILFDEILNSFKASVRGIASQFTIPGNSLVFQPNLYLTVMANTPFFMSPAQQVLVKGAQITPSNLDEIVTYVERQFHILEGKIAEVTAMVHEQNETQKIQNEGLVGGLFDLPENEKVNAKVPMVSPDANFVNMLRYSMLAVSLLPENSISHILVITDGVVAMPDSNVMESLLFQLHYDNIAISFFKVGSSFHPHSSAGYICYTDLLDFFSRSTMGTCLDSSPHPVHEPSMSMNIYHELFLQWSFQSNVKLYQRKAHDLTKWRSPNESFYSHRMPILLSKRQTDENTSASILLLLARRMREGFVLDGINYINGILEVQLSLQWKSLIYFVCKLSSHWPTIVKNGTHLEVFISAPYEFLHDITCTIKKDTKSLYRQAIIERFWLRLSQLSSGDTSFAPQLSVFQNSNVWYTIPEGIRGGIPVFNLLSTCPDANNRLQLSPNSNTCLKFVNAWKGICQLEVGNWRRWFHTHKVSLILRHDTPLPKHLHLPNSSQRFQVVQCRQAATALYGKLSEWASFVLLDNHTYLKLLHRDPAKPPAWFCIVRISSKLPCAVLNIAFLTNTPGYVRHETCEELKRHLSALSYMPSPGKTKENICCMLLQKPLEKILIRYERMPTDFGTVIFPDGTQPPHNTIQVATPSSGSLFTTLSRYLYHKRWIWSAAHATHPRLPDNAISRILTTLTGMRIKEGFSFAHSSSGIITMVLELWMEPTASCLVQYVLFPPHRALWGDDLASGSEEDNELESEYEGDLQMVTEVWIEPQYGRVVPTNNPRTSHMDNKHYYELADVISEIDQQCINSLLTMEYLSLMCQENNRSFSVDTSISFNRQLSTNIRNVLRKNSRSMLIESPNMHLENNTAQWYPIVSPRIEHIPFKFDPINILPLCQQTELLSSMFIERKDKSSTKIHDSNKANKMLLDNIQEHLTLLHDQEVNLSLEDSDKFTKQILRRHKNSCQCPIVEYRDDLPVSQWKCYIKAISVTHIILTFIPSTLNDLKALVLNDAIPNNDPTTTENCDRASSRGSNYSDVPINVTSSISLPIYVYDCPLAQLVSAYIHNYDETHVVTRDVYEDHRFKSTDSFNDDLGGGRRCFEETSASPEIKGEDFEIASDRSSSRHHSRTLVLVHTKCFTMTLFVALHQNIYVHCLDVQAAMDQCEDTINEIDITEYILTSCGHVKHNTDDKIKVQHLRQAVPCNELKSLHALIKDKFFKIVNVAFIPIPTSPEFYYCRFTTNSAKLSETKSNVSDDDTSNPPSDHGGDFGIYHSELNRMESFTSELISGDISPLFLHLICTVRYNNGDVANTSLKVLPTCLGELTESIDLNQLIEKKKLQVTLDIMCLTLPTFVQNVISEYSSQTIRTTSFCSDGFPGSLASTTSEASLNSEFPEPPLTLPENQRKAIAVLRDEIKWLLKDEIATALLDFDSVSLSTLNFVMKHVSDSRLRTSCIMDVIHLNFVFGASQSHQKFVEEFAKIRVPNYKLLQEDELYYLSKDAMVSDCLDSNNDELMNCLNRLQFRYDSLDNCKDSDDVASQASDISSGSAVGTDEAGYDEDVSNDDEECEWLLHLSDKRQNLPNFWLIAKVEQEAVTVYFHCRFLELATSLVDSYLEVQRDISHEIKDLCKRVNQSLLLLTLYETRICDQLLEPEDSVKDWTNGGTPMVSKHASQIKLRTMEETGDEVEPLMTSSVTLSETSLNFKPGYFSCPVMWQTQFVLHPRLKTGPGKSGISIGILALKNILDKFSVSNRNNMFVYRDNSHNVFYLRLQENVHHHNSASSKATSAESEFLSKSPSIASSPLGQNKCVLSNCGQSLTSLLSEDRVRFCSDKEGNEDTLILKVHGITAAGNDVQYELVQVLQNRLDDAVLEFLSVMLARNAMCPLTPEDVQFIQKPSAPFIIMLSMQDFVLQWLDSFIHYLKQNLLQFLNVPKYTDSRTQCHFKDYLESDPSRINDDNIFIYNQSQNPSSGNRGIACIALAVVYKSEYDDTRVLDEKIDQAFEMKNFQGLVASKILDKNVDPLPEVYLEFRLWKQGRVNIDNLSIKLKEAISQATWDIIMEYQMLKEPLCCAKSSNQSLEITTVDDINHSNGKEIEFNCPIKVPNNRNIKASGKQKLKFIPTAHRPRHIRANTVTSKTSRSITFEDTERDKDQVAKSALRAQIDAQLTPLETGDDGVLNEMYSKYLPAWLEFGSVITAPSVKKQKIVLTNAHLIPTIVKEVVPFVQDTPKAFRAVPSHAVATGNEGDEIFVPYDAEKFVQKCVVISRNFDHWKIATKFSENAVFADVMSPHALKHSYRFLPSRSGNKFIPRQKILWILINCDSILIYTYNWARDTIDKLIANCTKLGQWLSLRACFLNSVTSQKLGLFHNQAITQKTFLNSNNPYIHVIGSTSMKEFPKDDIRKNLTQPVNSSILEIFRDSFLPYRYNFNDPVVVFTDEMEEIKSVKAKSEEEMKMLHSMYQSRTSTTNASQIFMLMQNSRIIHYCHTPLLFLSKWRIKSAATRDHSLCSQVQSYNKGLLEDSWHTELCYGFFCEYRRYLQTLGFIPLQIDDNSDKKVGIWARDNSSYNSVFYIQRTIMGGILLFTVEFNEPFFTTILHAIECNRLQTITSRASINRFTLCFLDECDRVKILMHLHSFTYDYHLRCIYNYISNTPGVNKVCDRYDVNKFFDEFMKYYTKGPNFARNLIHADTITIKDLITEGKQLYDYLLTNVGQYDFKVVDMDKEDGDAEYILVQVTSSPQVSYKDSQDRQHTDDFEITLIVFNLCTPYSPTDNVLHLKYYLILTTKSEIYPKSEIEQKLGKFRTVSSTAHCLSGSNNLAKPDPQNDLTSSDDDINITTPDESFDNAAKVEISQESVNYLGYYSSHEEVMQQMILDKAKTTQKHIRDMVAKGMVHCRTHLLWNKLVQPSSLPNILTYDEFMELKSFAKLEHLCDIHPKLGPLLNQPLNWYQGLAKLLLNKYKDHNRFFVSPDGNIEHYVILHPVYFGAFMLLSVDMHTSRGDLYAVYREPHKQEDPEHSLVYRKDLLDGFINCICFYLWYGMI